MCFPSLSVISCSQNRLALGWVFLQTLLWMTGKAAMVWEIPYADSCLHKNFLNISHCGTFFKCSFPSERTQSHRQAFVKPTAECNWCHRLSQSQHSYSVCVSAPCYHSTMTRNPQMPPLGPSTRVLYAQAVRTWAGATGGTKNSLNEGEGDEEPEKKPRLGDIAVSIHSHTVLKRWLISSFTKCLIIDKTVGSPRVDALWYFPSCQPIYWPQKLLDTQHIGRCMCTFCSTTYLISMPQTLPVYHAMKTIIWRIGQHNKEDLALLKENYQWNTEDSAFYGEDKESCIISLPVYRLISCWTAFPSLWSSCFSSGSKQTDPNFSCFIFPLCMPGRWVKHGDSTENQLA